MDSSGRKIPGREFCRRECLGFVSFLIAFIAFFPSLSVAAVLDLDSVRFTRFELRARQPIKNLIVGAAKSIFVKIGSHLSIAPRQPRARSYSTRNVIPGCNRRSRSDARVNSCGGIIARGRKAERASVPSISTPTCLFRTKSAVFSRMEIRRLTVIKGFLPYISAYMCDVCVAYSVYSVDIHCASYISHYMW